MDRRKYLKYTAGIVGGLVVGAAAGYYGGVSSAPSIVQTLTKTATETRTVTQGVTPALQGEYGPWPPTAPVIPGWPPATWTQYPGLEVTGITVDMYGAPHTPQAFGNVWARRHGCKPPNFTPIPWDGRHARVMAELTGGSDVDVVYHLYRWRGELRKGDYLMDLSSWVRDKFPKAWWDSITPVKKLSMQFGADDPRIMGIPADGDQAMSYYRKDIFKDMGLDPEKMMTPEGRLETYKALNRDKTTANGGGLDLDNDGKIDTWAMQWMFGRRLDTQLTFACHFMYRQWKAGLPALWIDENRNPLINNEAAVMALEDIIAYLPYAIPGSMTAAFDELHSNWVQGKVAVFPDTGAGWRTTFEDPSISKTAGKTDYLPSIRPVMYEGVQYGVNKKAAHSEQALEYLLEWSAPDIAIKSYEGKPPYGPNWGDPVCEWMWDDPEFKVLYPGFLEGWKRSWRMSSEWPCLDWVSDEPNADLLMDRLDYYIVEAYNNRMKPKEALDACAAEWKKTLV